VKKIAIYNIKGGVGKTTTTINLACLFASKGLSVLVWDLDPQGGSSYFFNKQNKNSSTHARLFDRYINIYDVISPSDSYQIDVISNDPFFSDQFFNTASGITKLNFVNHELIKMSLQEVEDDYDICLIDCSPGKFMLHDNIFNASDLLLIPNIPAPLSIYCNNILLDDLNKKVSPQKKILSFYNMVQVNKTLHKYYLENMDKAPTSQLANFIPFYAEIESVNFKRESIFHSIKNLKTNLFYENLWKEICEKMSWYTEQTGKLFAINQPVAALPEMEAIPQVIEPSTTSEFIGKISTL
jgi:chromosome partitioning protein